MISLLIFNVCFGNLLRSVDATSLRFAYFKKNKFENTFFKVNLCNWDLCQWYHRSYWQLSSILAIDTKKTLKVSVMGLIMHLMPSHTVSPMDTSYIVTTHCVLAKHEPANSIFPKFFKTLSSSYF